MSESENVWDNPEDFWKHVKSNKKLVGIAVSDEQGLDILNALRDIYLRIDEEPEDAEQPHGIYARGKRRKVLKQKHPAAATTTAFTKWIKENLNSKQQTAFAKAHKAMMEFYNSKDKELKAELPDLASDWGLPVKLAAQADTQWLMKVLTAATIIAQ
jgi:hypothetical protein